jgi:hypothetical protein
MLTLSHCLISQWDAVVAEIGGLTVKSAKERYRLMAIKFGWNKDSTASGGGGTESTNDDGESTNNGNAVAPPAPATPRKRGGGVTKKQGRVGDSAKKGRGRKKAVSQSVEQEAENSGVNAGTNASAPEMDMEDADAYGEA